MSEVSIANKSLGWLGEKRILSFDDTQNQAVIIKENYADSRDFVLAAHDWPFAIKRFSLAKLVNAPTFGFANAFQLPNDVLRVITMNEESNETRGEGVEAGFTSNNWQVEGKTIVTDEGTANIRCVARITNTDLFSFGFVQCFAARLAADIAFPLTNSTKREEAMEIKYKLKLREAKSQDGRQGKSKRLVSRWLNRARWSGGGGGGFSGPTV